MIGLLCFVLAVLASPFKSKIRLEAENAVLRHQLIVLRRKLRGRVQLANSDSWFFVQLYRWFPSKRRVHRCKYESVTGKRLEGDPVCQDTCFESTDFDGPHTDH